MTSVFVKKDNGNQELFDYLSQEHGIIILESDIQEIERLLFEEIELPSEEEVMEFKVLRDKPTKIDLNRLHAFKKGANFILNKLKGESK